MNPINFIFSATIISVIGTWIGISFFEVKGDEELVLFSSIFVGWTVINLLAMGFGKHRNF